MDLTHASISCYAGTIPGDTLEIIIPFTVTVTSQAVLEVGVSTLVESMAIDSSVTCQWIVGLPNCGEDANGSITATEDDPAEVDARLCCVTPGDYTLTVRVTATHTISGGDDCDAGSFYVAGDIEDAVILSLSFEEDACLE